MSIVDLLYITKDALWAVPQFFKRAFILGVRLVEYTLTGQSEYTIYRGEIADFDVVADKLKADLLREQVEKFLEQKLGIKMQRPVVVDLYSGNEFNWRGIVMELRGNLGRYHFENMGKVGMVHMVYVRKGLSKNRFKAILAHEIAHAFLREEKLMNWDRYLREGFCRWVEYQCLMELGERREAEKLKRIKSLKHGKEIEKIFALEGRVGFDRVMEIIRRIT